jgi:hypothetical protein
VSTSFPKGEHNHVAYVGDTYYEGITIEASDGTGFDLSTVDSVECLITTPAGVTLLSPTATVTDAAAGEIDITDGEEAGPVAFDAVVEVRPQITLAGYAGRCATRSARFTRASSKSKPDSGST